MGKTSTVLTSVQENVTCNYLLVYAITSPTIAHPNMLIASWSRIERWYVYAAL